MSYYVYTYTNTNPTVGPVKKNGTQEVGVYDAQLGNKRYIQTSKEKVDEFIDTRNSEGKNARKKTAILTAAGTAIGALIALIAGARKPEKVANCMLGAMLGMIGGMIPGAIQEDKVINEIDKKFIEENK
ncbi:MAG: hypothetical protein IJB79_02050 [Candidatus Gastranaerophilales bacterium]|nr:hypothetical protein [Candidatus Gastranaerophilales bacterium]